MRFVWIDGTLIKTDDGKISVLTHTHTALQYEIFEMFIFIRLTYTSGQ